MIRTHAAGSLTAAQVGDQVTLAGWVARRRDHGGVAFIDLREASGVVQVVVREEVAHQLRAEYCLKVVGTVEKRPEGNENPAIPTGEIEVIASDVEILSASAPLPFPIDDAASSSAGTVGEEVRLRHRYLDLRRSGPAHNLRLRSKVNAVAREVLGRHEFVEVETPTLTRSTPEGARDFLVPARLRPGSWYALPQSPQLFKQLLMVGGMERYFQIARCYRDEDFRADRQPEFTQLDVEASFIDEEDVYALCEELMVALWREVLDVELPVPFPRMPYEEAMRRFGSDKPDLRFDLELVDLGEVLADTGVGVFKGVLDDGGSVVAVSLPGGGELTRKEFDGWIEFAKRRGAKGLAWGVVEDGEAGTPTLRSPLTKFMTDEEVAGIIAACEAAVGDAIFFGAGPTQFARELMGAVRVALAHDRGLVPAGEWRFVWVTEWPMFEWAEDEKRWDALHHPFTAPAEGTEGTFHDDPGPALARAYDLALNGTELGGGSIRIHDRGVQERVFELLGISAEDAEERFGFLLRGLSFGAPPHGGIAFGLDRIVMLMTGATSLRDVIPFPKTQSGGDPMTDAPAGVDEPQLTELGLRLLPPPVKG